MKDKCQICDKVCQQQPSADKLCDGCWERVSRLDDVLGFKRGAEIVMEKVMKVLLNYYESRG